MDPLSDVLRVVRLGSSVFFSACLAAPWAVSSPEAEDLARALHLRPDCLSLFHLVAGGHCWVTAPGIEPLEVGAGAIVIFPHADPHAMMSTPGLETRPLTEVMPSVLRPAGETVPRFELGRGSDRVRLVCGYLRCDQRFNPLAGALPTLLIADPPRGELRALSTCRGERRLQLRRGAADSPRSWLERTFRYTVEEAEARRPGGGEMLSRLTELLYVAVLRQYMEQAEPHEGDWLGGVNDPHVGRALRLMHEHPSRKWTVTTLARECGLSRSALGRRFRLLVGQPPMRYLARWRIELARTMLRNPMLSIAQISSRVGFDSTVAFHHAFKRETGRPPAAWRDSRTGLRA